MQTGCCPHTAIRDDIAMNLEAVEELERDQGPLDLVLVESGGDNLTAVFSPALADVQIFVIDVAGGDDIPRKGGPGIARADLLVINKTDLAPYVGSDVALMLSDAKARRDGLPVQALSLVSAEGARPVAAWVRERHRALCRRRGAADGRCRRSPTTITTATLTEPSSALLCVERHAGGHCGHRAAPRDTPRAAGARPRTATRSAPACSPRRPVRWRAITTAPRSSSAPARRS